MAKYIPNFDIERYINAFKKRMISIVLGLSISIFSISYIMKKIDVEILLNTIYDFNSSFLPLIITLTLCNVWLRVHRWIIIAQIDDKFIGHKCGWTGYFLNFILPAKLGEVAKIVLASKLLNAKYEDLAIKTIFDRLFDFYLISAATLVSIYLFGPGYFKVFSIHNVFFATGLVSLSLVMIFYFRNRITKLAKEIAPKYSKLITNVDESLKNTSMIMATLCFGITLVSFAIDIAISYLLLLAFNFELLITAPFLITLFIYMSAMLPSAPGQLGLHQTAVILSMSLFSINETPAVAYSVVIQFITFAVIFFTSVSIWIYDMRPDRTVIECDL